MRIQIRFSSLFNHRGGGGGKEKKKGGGGGGGGGGGRGRRGANLDNVNYQHQKFVI